MRDGEENELVGTVEADTGTGLVGKGVFEIA